MGMKIGLQPELTPAERAALERWLKSALRHAELSPGSFPLVRRIGVYINDQALQVTNDYWMLNGYQCGIGNHNSGVAMSQMDRLAILGAIISAVSMWDTLQEDYSTAMCRVLLETYNTGMSGMVRARQGVATGLAFSADRLQVAARMGTNDDVWYLPTGEQVVPDESWTRVQ